MPLWIDQIDCDLVADLRFNQDIILGLVITSNPSK